VRKSYSSFTNIPFTLTDSKLDGEFLKGAEARGMVQPMVRIYLGSIQGEHRC